MVTCWLLTMEAQVQCQDKVYWICGIKSGILANIYLTS
jgi:hypothetical protein